MFVPLIALGLFGAVVWVIAQAIFMLVRKDSSADHVYPPRGTLEGFFEQNYGTRFVPDAAIWDEAIRRL